MSTVNPEYRNQNRYRQYPFEDDATLVATNGTKLPSDFLIDAMLYPIDLANGIYMKMVDYSTGTITLADTVTDKVHGQAVWDDTDSVAYVYEPEAPNRMVGILVLGDGRINQSVGGQLLFTAATAPFTPTAFYPLNQEGVRGLVLEDGTFYTGAIAFEGRNGVSVYTHVDTNGRSVVEFIVSGVNYDIEPCFECEVVRCLRIVTTEGSMLIPAACGSNMACITSAFGMGDVCPPTNIKLPSRKKDPCEEAQTCTDITGGPAGEFFICPDKGALYLTTPSAANYNNPLWVENEEEPAPPPDFKQVTAPVGMPLEARERILARMFDAAALSRGRIKIEYRGLTTDRHY